MNALFCSKVGIIVVFWLVAAPVAHAEFKVSEAYGGITDHGDYLAYEWHIHVASDSTEPMYAVHFTTDSLRQLGYYNFHNSKGWGAGEAITSSSGHHLTVWYECNYSNRVQAGDSMVISADIDKRFIAGRIGPGVMIMTGLPLAEGGEGIVAAKYVPLAVLHSSTNGMLKTWANQHGLVPEESRMRFYNAAEIEDPDGDGVCNLQEYIEDTDPTNAESYMQILAVPSAKGSVTVSAYPLSERAVYEVYGSKSASRPTGYIGSFTAETGGLVVKGRGKYKDFELVATLK